jgi:hypothetical protein
LLFLYQKVLAVEPGQIAGVIRAVRPQRLPVVLGRNEVRRVLGHMEGTTRVIADLLDGSGLRVLDALRLRVHDIDLGRMELLIRHGKGGKDRRTILPTSAKPGVQAQLDATRAVFERDAADGIGVSLPEALDRKYANAAREWGWAYVFPSSGRCVDPRDGLMKRHHLHESVVQQAWRLGTRQLTQIDSQDGPVQQLQGRARRLQCRQWRLLSLDDVFQKPAHGLPVEIPRVPFAVEEDVGPHPGHQPRSRRLGRPTLPSGVGDLIEQPGRLSRCGRRRRSQNACGHGSLLRQGESPKGRPVNVSAYQRSLPVKEKMVLLALPT